MFIKNKKFKSNLIFIFLILLFLIGIFFIYKNFNFFKLEVKNKHKLKIFRQTIILDNIKELANYKRGILKTIKVLKDGFLYVGKDGIVRKYDVYSGKIISECKEKLVLKLSEKSKNNKKLVLERKREGKGYVLKIVNVDTCEFLKVNLGNNLNTFLRLKGREKDKVVIFFNNKISLIDIYTGKILNTIDSSSFNYRLERIFNSVQYENFNFLKTIGNIAVGKGDYNGDGNEELFLGIYDNNKNLGKILDRILVLDRNLNFIKNISISKKMKIPQVYKSYGRQIVYSSINKTFILPKLSKIENNFVLLDFNGNIIKVIKNKVIKPGMFPKLVKNKEKEFYLINRKLYDKTGKLIKKFNLLGDNGSTEIIGDINGDGIDEIIFLNTYHQGWNVIRAIYKLLSSQSTLLTVYLRIYDIYGNLLYKDQNPLFVKENIYLLKDGLFIWKDYFLNSKKNPLVISPRGLDTTNFRKFKNTNFSTDGIFLYYYSKKVKGDYVGYIDYDTLNFGKNFKYYIKDKNNIYSIVDNGNGNYSLYIENDIDVKTFRELEKNKGFFKDKNFLYYLNNGRIKKNSKVDINTFVEINEGISKDKNNIYIHQNIDKKNNKLRIPRVLIDTKTFSHLKYNFYKDKNYIFVKGGVFLKKFADSTDNFEIIDKYFVKKSNHIYYTKGVFIPRLVEDDSIDVKSFIKLSYNIYKDKNYIYYRDKNDKSFIRIKGDYKAKDIVAVSTGYTNGYLKDKDYIYYLYNMKEGKKNRFLLKIVKGADVKTFKIKRGSNIASDKFHKYVDGKIWLGRKFKGKIKD